MHINYEFKMLVRCWGFSTTCLEWKLIVNFYYETFEVCSPSYALHLSLFTTFPTEPTTDHTNLFLLNLPHSIWLTSANMFNILLELAVEIIVNLPFSAFNWPIHTLAWHFQSWPTYFTATFIFFNLPSCLILPRTNLP